MIRNTKGQVLDYGCGTGRFIGFCRDRDLIIIGTDTYEGVYESWAKPLENIYPIKDKKVPFSDSTFQAIVSNQTFEHISPDQVPIVAKEISRLLLPDGVLISIFPTKKTIIEAHIGVPFVQYSRNGSNLQRVYLHLCFLLKIGYWRSENKRGLISTKKRNFWVNDCMQVLESNIFFNPLIKWEQNFYSSGCKVENISFLLLIYSLPIKLKPLLRKIVQVNFFKNFFNLLVELRLGVVLKVTKINE
jgi:SAM-dependent methyltransferase